MLRETKLFMKHQSYNKLKPLITLLSSPTVMILPAEAEKWLQTSLLDLIANDTLLFDPSPPESPLELL